MSDFPFTSILRPGQGFPAGSSVPLPASGESPSGRTAITSSTLINIFRFAPNGQLIEEWVEYDPSAFLTQLTAQD